MVPEQGTSYTELRIIFVPCVAEAVNNNDDARAQLWWEHTFYSLKQYFYCLPKAIGFCIKKNWPVEGLRIVFWSLDNAC